MSTIYLKLDHQYYTVDNAPPEHGTESVVQSYLGYQWVVDAAGYGINEPKVTLYDPASPPKNTYNPIDVGYWETDGRTIHRLKAVVKIVDHSYDISVLSGSPPLEVQTDWPDNLFGPDPLAIDYEWQAVRIPDPKWHFVFERGQDGKAEMKFYENGKLIKKTNPSDGQWVTTKAADGTVVKKWVSDCAYDDATPIPVGTYNVVYRTDGGISPKCWEFTDKNGASTVPNRQAIQLHVGNSTGDSEGCIVASNSSFLNAVRAQMDKFLVGTPTASAPNGMTFYDLPVPITFEVKGAVKQPWLQLSADPKSAVAEGTSITPKFYLRDYGVEAGLTKKLDIYFKTTGTAKFGQDFTFGADVKKVDAAGTKWKVTLDSGEVTQGVQIKLLKDQPGRSREAQETLKLSVYDIVLMGDNTRAPVKWKPYEISSGSVGTLHIMEKQLLGATDAARASNGSFQLTIKADPAAIAGATATSAMNAPMPLNEGDTFTFAEGSGRSGILGFEAGPVSSDRIQVSQELLRSYDEVMEHASQHWNSGGVYTTIRANADDLLVRKGVELASLNRDDFAFI